MTSPPPAEPTSPTPPPAPPPAEARRAALASSAVDITGTPRRPAMVRRRGLFLALLGAYALTLAVLIYLSLRQHHLLR